MFFIIMSISLKNKTMTSNHISLDAMVSSSKPELPVVSACSTLSLPWRFLEGFQACCTLDSRSPGQAQAPLHPLTVSQIPNCPLQYVKDSSPSKKSVVPCNSQEQPHKSTNLLIIYTSFLHAWIYNLTVHQLSC